MNKTELYNLLKSKNYTTEEIDNFLKMMEPMFEFYSFMQSEHNMNYDDVEQESAEFSRKMFPEYLENISSSDNKMHHITEISGDIMKRYADKYNYQKSEDVKISLNKYMRLFLKSQFKKDE